MEPRSVRLADESDNGTSVLIRSEESREKEGLAGAAPRHHRREAVAAKQLNSNSQQ
jgi:hypothetical protein